MVSSLGERRFLAHQVLDTSSDSLITRTIRWDMIAELIIASAQHFKDIPIVVRLRKTDAVDGQTMVT